MRGFTLLELVAVLLLGSIVAGSLGPAARRYRDRAAVLSARESVAGLIVEARVQAMRSGRAHVALTTTPARAEMSVDDSLRRSVRLDGVSVELGGGRARTELPFGALGLGSFASETVRFVAGGEVVQLIVSSYGRVRRP